MDSATTKHRVTNQTSPMASVDHAWLRMDSPVSPMVINSVFIFKTPLDKNVFHQRMLENFVSIDRFRCVPEPSSYGEHWSERAIDRDYHFPVDETPYDTPEDLQQAATLFINQTLESDKPLWRMLLLKNYRAGSAVIIRIHHAYADGMALMKVLLGMMDEGAVLKKASEQKPQVKPSNDNWSSLIKGIQPFFTGKGKWLETLGLVEELSTELLKMGLSPGEENAFKSPDLCGKKQLVWSEPLDLTEVMTIAKFQHSKLNDVLLSSVAGAFRRYLKSINQLTSWSELRTIIPVDLRSKIKAEDLGNYFGLVFLSLPLGIEDPIQRAKLLNKRMIDLKQSKQAWLVFQLLQFSGFLPDIAEKELIRLFSSKASAVMTNVPGPSFPLHLGGNELDQILFWVPQSGSVGVGVSVLTYNHRVQFGLMTDKQLINEPSDIIQCFNSEFESLLLETLMTAPWPK